MAALLGLDFEAVVEVAEGGQGEEICAAANDNAVGQVVVSGRSWRARSVGERGAKRAMELPVSAPFTVLCNRRQMKQAALPKQVPPPCPLSPILCGTGR